MNALDKDTGVFGVRYGDTLRRDALQQVFQPPEPPEDPITARYRQEASEQQEAPSNLLSQGQDAYGLYDKVKSGGGSMTTGGWVTSAIKAQLAMSKATDREYEGVKTGNVLDGHFATEPWAGYLADKWGLGVTSGERFDAAIANGEYGTALKRLPSVLHRWATPGSDIVRGVAEKHLGKKAGWFADPVGKLFRSFG